MTPQAVRLAMILFLPFSTFLAVLHSLTYWSLFDINVFAFISISDVLMLSLKPLTLVLTSGVIVNLIMFKIGGSPLSRSDSIDSEQPEISPGRPRSWQRFLIVIILAGPTLAITFWLSSAARIASLIGIGLLVPLISSQIEKNTNLASHIPNSIVRHFLIFMITGSTFVSVYKGFEEAENIKTGSSYLATSADPCSERLIGKAGDFIFYYSPSSGEIRYVNQASIQSITIRKRYNSKCDMSSLHQPTSSATHVILG